MATIVLEVEDRATLGKKTKALRRQGMTPANVFGHGIESQAIKVGTAEVEKTLAVAGATKMITLKDRASKGNRQVLVKGVQRDTLSGKLLHVDFHQVSLKDKVKVEVPLVFQGEAPASRRKDLIMLESLNSVEVECLPGNIPENIAVDVSGLEEAGDHLLVGDLTITGDNITILTSVEEMVARVARAKIAEVAEAAEGEAEGVTEGAPAEAAQPEGEPQQ